MEDTDKCEFAATTIMSSGIIPTGTDIEIWGILQGTYNGRTLTMGKVCTMIYELESHVVYSYKYKRSLTGRAVFTGSFMEFGCSAKINSAIVVYGRNYRKKLYPYDLEKTKNIKTGDTEFDRQFIACR